jgi:fructosamine-3-kinase
VSSDLQGIAELLGVDAGRLEAVPVGGGCISEALRVSLREDGSKVWFVKRNRADFLDNFQAEADGLERLAAAGALRVPVPRQVARRGAHSYFVAEWIETGRSTGHDFFARFGNGLARLHEATRGTEIGLSRDNYLGAARQLNQPTDDWVRFVAERRLGYQLRWGVEEGAISGSLRRDLEAVIGRLDRLLEGRESETVLLHGDLWSGNYLSDGRGEPVLIDPAVYRGCREAEFGMLRLFGGCPAVFYEAYQAAWPLAPGWEQRSDVYVLYHLLNHLNLFGGGYRGQCGQLAGRLLAAT